MELDLAKSGLITALPPAALTLMIVPVAVFADWTQKNGYLTTTQVRKIVSCCGLLGEATFMTCAILLESPMASVACIVCAAAFASGGIGGGYSVNPLDIAPAFSSIVMGFSNSFGSLTGIVSPILAGFIVPNGTPSEWNIVLAIPVVIYLSASIIFFCFGSGELQEWARVDDFNEQQKSKASIMKAEGTIE